jgi:hypothetical protein
MKLADKLWFAGLITLFAMHVVFLGSQLWKADADLEKCRAKPAQFRSQEKP